MAVLRALAWESLIISVGGAFLWFWFIRVVAFVGFRVKVRAVVFVREGRYGC
jgi:hypothetical protein